MKRPLSLLLVTLLLFTSLAAARAEEELTVFDALSTLLNGRSVTLTVSAEAEGELADFLAPYGAVTCTLRREGGSLLLEAVCEGEAYLRASADAETVSFDTNLLENGEQRYDWAALEPDVKLADGSLQISMTGPDHELIRFSCEVSGESAEDYELEIQIGYITGPGNVHSLWDGLSCHGGETAREFYFSFSEEDYALLGEGTETAEAGDGTLSLTRDERYTVSHNDEELGEVQVHAVLSIG